MKNRKLKLEEVALLVGVSCYTINNWYRAKRKNPDMDVFQLLPEPQQASDRQTRYWTQNDVYKLIEFSSKLPKGRNGIMGKYKGRGTKNG